MTGVDEKARRYALLKAQLDMAQREDKAVMLVVAGHAATHKSVLVNQLNHWLENRQTEVHALAPSEEDRLRPYWWRYWRRVPARGRVGVFVHGWYGDVLFARVEQRIQAGAFADRLDEINRFEATLTHDNVVVVKVWLDIDEAQQAERLHHLQSDPTHSWQVSERHWQRHAQYAAIQQCAEQMREATHTAHAPWHCIASETPSQQLKEITALLQDALSQPALLPAASAGKLLQGANGPLEGDKARLAPQRLAIDDELASEGSAKNSKIPKKRYRQALDELQARLANNHRRCLQRSIPVVLAFEGHDAAGKGGSIHRVTTALDARYYRVYSVSAPSDEERLQPWLWRFWRRLPQDGRVAIFDRTWYGRVLVERVEGFARKSAWQRGFTEICHFEDQLLAHGAVVGKFFLAISKDEQLKRFKARANTPHKQHKLTDEDWRNRQRWDDYQQALEDMLAHTHTQGAPWQLINTDDKRRARLSVLTQLNDLLETRLESP
ncbi:polyphosphate:AMP phosphotransferase [Halomonas sp. TBZ9]|uniref:Polyphosphate:AMP phosphotransferase n=1 Tax=Vreelandella azerica TaxID=2732867 RepID=A0A7Y3XA26_9GAMM|nr:polyphosphate:AMP phosphotransferase [Halomonas azerica]NOG30750.1 polyphosphate:AMP phosphotransferase [Halomonas azerica]